MQRFKLAMAVAALGGLAVTGCDRDDTRTSSNTSSSTTSTAPAVDVTVNKDKMKDMASRTGAAIERGAEKTGEVAKEAGRDTRDALATAGRKIENGAERVKDNVRVSADNARQAGARDTAAPNGTAAAPDAEGIRDVLAQCAQASLTKGGLDDLVERLAKPDRDRLNPSLQKDNPDLDGRIDQFQKDWKAKYNQDFNIKNEEAAFPNDTFSIAQGAAAGDSAASDNTARGGGTIQVAASHGMPALTIPIVHEAPDRWKIDVPDTLTADKLKANVLAHLTAADEMKDQWPADVNQAYAAVTHHVLMALMDQPVQK